MTVIHYTVVVVLALLVLYAGVRLATSAWYRSRREHLTEVAAIFGKKKPPRLPDKPDMH